MLGQQLVHTDANRAAPDRVRGAFSHVPARTWRLEFAAACPCNPSAPCPSCAHPNRHGAQVAAIVASLIAEQLGYKVDRHPMGSSADLYQHTAGCTDEFGELWPESNPCKRHTTFQNPPVRSWAAVEAHHRCPHSCTAVCVCVCVCVPRTSQRRQRYPPCTHQVWESTEQEKELSKDVLIEGICGYISRPMLHTQSTVIEAARASGAPAK